MKRFVLFFLLFIPLSLSAQSFCSTPALSQISSNDVSRIETRSTMDYSSKYLLRVYFHVINNVGGSGGVSSSVVQSAYSTLCNDFNSHNIYFLWDGVIDPINNSSYMDPSNSIFSINNHQNGIDIYIYPEAAEVVGLANGFGYGTELYVSGQIDNISTSITHVISHEMGHILNLYHTHHGTVFELGGDPNQCPELVNGTNSDVCGDYVEDTPADPYLGGFVGSSCNYTGTARDANNNLYTPDTHLIMSYTPPSCMEYFSTKQVQRMKTAIIQKQVLQNASIIFTGPTIPEASSVYSIQNLPSGYNVTWTYTPSSGTSLSSSTFVPNSPANNQCIINNSSKQYINGTLKATITKSGTTIVSLEKEIRSGDGFTATCSQPLGYIIPQNGNVTNTSSTSASFSDNAAFVVKKNSLGSYPITITSSFFTNATITHTSISGLSWQHSGNTITLSYPANNNIDPVLVVMGNKSTDYRVYRFSIYSQLDIQLQLTSEVQGRSVKLVLVPDEEAAKDYSVEALACFTNELAEREWDVTISNAMTGKIVYECHTTGASLEINATEWTPGIYVIKACVANQELTQKIVVN